MFGMMHLIDLTIAVVIDWIIGDPYSFPHPVIYIGKLIRALENKGRKICKTNKSLKAFGGLIVLIVAFTSFIIPFGVLYIVRNNFWVYHLLNIFILWTTLACKTLGNEAKKVYDSLKIGDIKDARLKLSYIVGRDTNELSEEEIIRADVETVAENASDGIIAPLFYAMIGGAPLAMMYKGINTMDSMLGYMNEKFLHIGFFPAKVDDVFNLIPARISGVLMCFTAPVVNGNIIESLKIMARDRKNHKSPNCAYPEAATAGALKIQVGGVNRYFGEIVYKPTIGDKISELSYTHIFGSIKLMYASEILMVLLYALIIMNLR